MLSLTQLSKQYVSICRGIIGCDQPVSSIGSEVSNRHEIRNIQSVSSIPTSILLLQGSRAGYRTLPLLDCDWRAGGNCGFTV
jgi:hypothetical protein